MRRQNLLAPAALGRSRQHLGAPPMADDGIPSPLRIHFSDVVDKNWPELR